MKENVRSKNVRNVGLVWSTEKRKVNDLLPYSRNPRQMTDKQTEDLKKSLERFNLVELPAINTDDTIIAGHQRLRVLQLLGRGEELIEVRMPNRKLTKREFEQYLITSNAVGGSWDIEKLMDFELNLLIDSGLDEAELEGMWSGLLEVDDDGFQVEKELAAIKKPKTKPGDLIQLGPHKLLCGDATDPATLKLLFGNERASMIYCDPVYNLSVDYNRGIGGKQNYGGNVNDHRTDDEYEEFLRKSIENALLVAKDDCHVFYYCDEKYIWLLQGLYRELGIENRRVCLWVKNGQNPTPDVAFSKCYEPCVYGTRGRPFLSKNLQNLNEVMNKEIETGNRLVDGIFDLWNIWLVKRLAGNDYEHATSKPPTLHEKAIRRCTRPGDIILDSFSGSASTLAAAHQLKRKAYLVEIEPVFCDLAIKRYELLTNDKAKKLN